MSTANLSVRVDSELKKEVERCLDAMGLNISVAINIYLRQIVRQNAIPFRVCADPAVNQETLDAIAEGRCAAHDGSVPGYRDMESLIKALNS